MTGLIDSWEIGVSLVLDDGITGQLGGIETQFDAVQTAVDKINASLKLIPGNIADVKAAAAGLSASFTAAANAAERIRTAVSAGGGTGGTPAFDPGQAAQPAAVTPAPVVSGDATAPPQTTPTSNLPMVVPGSTARGPESWTHVPISGYGTGGTPAGGDSDASGAPPNFTIPPTISPDPGAKDPRHGGGQPNSDGTHDFWTNLFLFGTGAELVKGAVGGAAEISATQARLAINSASPAQIQTLTTEAQRAQAGSPLSIQDVLGIGQDYYSVTGEIPDQKTLAGLVNDAITMQGEGVEDPVDQIYSGIKAAEIAGKLNTKNPDGSINTAPMMGYLDMVAEASILANGKVDYNTALQMQTNAGPEGSRLSPHALAYSLLLSQQLGGSKTGVGIQAEGSEFLGGKMNQGVATILEGLKGPDGKPLLDKSKVQKMGLAGTWAQSGALVDQAEAISDPYQWTVDHLLPALAGMSPDDANATLAAIMRTQTRATGQRLMGDAINSGVQLERRYEQLQSTDTPAQATATLENQSLQTNLQTAGAGLGALTTALAAAAQPQLLAGLKAFDGTLAAATAFVNHNPEVGQAVDVGVTGGMAYLGYRLLKGLKQIFDNFGSQVEKDAKFADGAPVTPGDGAVPLSVGSETSLMAVLSKMNSLLAALSLSGDTMLPPDGFHYVHGGFGKIAPNDPGYITGPDGSEIRPYHVVLKNQETSGPTMPSGPTIPPISSAMPHPGKTSTK